MSRSDRPRSSTAENPVPSDAPEASPPGRAARRPARIRFLTLARWLHVYLSMFGLAAVLFFSVTGLTLNHPDWFFAGAEDRNEAEGQVDRAWLHVDGAPDGAEPEARVDRLEVVEYLRSTHGVRGALVDFGVDEYECYVTFKGPGYSADAFIDRDTGRYRLTETYQGFVAVLNDLHKGRDTGPAWSLVIDISAVALTAISLTGLVLLFYLKLRRRPGLTVALAGTVVLAVIYALRVP